MSCAVAGDQSRADGQAARVSRGQQPLAHVATHLPRRLWPCGGGAKVWQGPAPLQCHEQALHPQRGPCFRPGDCPGRPLTALHVPAWHVSSLHFAAEFNCLPAAATLHSLRLFSLCSRPSLYGFLTASSACLPLAICWLIYATAQCLARLTSQLRVQLDFYTML